jgi:hypothetical protein
MMNSQEFTMKSERLSQPTSDNACKLTPEELALVCDPASFSFETTKELPDLQNFIGQPRAYRALS